MKILLLNAGNETGGGMRHLLDLLRAFSKRQSITCVLGVFEKGKLYEQAQQLPIKVVHFQGKSFFGFRLLGLLRQFIVSQDVTHVHTHGPRANVIMRQLRRLVRIPWVATIHSDPFIDFQDQGLYGKLLKHVHMGAIQKADHLITVSDSLCQTLSAAGIPREKITVIHNGFDFSVSQFPAKHGMEIAKEIGLLSEWRQGNNPKQMVSHIVPKELLIVQVARLEKVKGHEWMFKALHRLQKQQTLSLRLVLVGGGSKQQQLSQLSKKLGLEEQIHFAGETDDVPFFYRMAHLVALSSLSEGFPYVLLEAARFQKPVVATDVGDVGMLINDAAFGWLVPPADEQALATALLEAAQLHERGELAEKGVALHTYAKNHFSLDNCVEEVYNVYKRLTS